ncbi:MAG: hypothetical protein AAFQ47_10125 [Pseudomonadota bacterium]
MAKPSKFIFTEGVGSDFNPKCNVRSDVQVNSDGMPRVSEVAAEVMRKRAEDRRQEEAYREAQRASKSVQKEELKRWLSNDDLI